MAHEDGPEATDPLVGEEDDREKDVRPADNGADVPHRTFVFRRWLLLIFVVAVTFFYIGRLVTRFGIDDESGVVSASKPLRDSVDVYLARLHSAIPPLVANHADDIGSHPQWVVITSINLPTNAIRRLADLGDWWIVIVADLKTPDAKTYMVDLRPSQRERVHMLTIDGQRNMSARGYESVDMVPYAAYTRKTLGYLFAMEHGARTIYETDDDNEIIARSPSEFNANWPPDTILPPQTILTYNLSHGVAVGDGSGRGLDSRRLPPLSGRIVVNPYAHFGQPTVWPRGYPLENIDFSTAGESTTITDDDTDNAERPLGYHYSDCSGKRPLIQQGLANGDPDVDAVFRLTRRFRARINITFDSNAQAVALPEGVMAPFNSQNTLFHYDALWGLMIPRSTSFRVCDIWRGYWAQRLLWEISAELAFTGPSVYQDRNAHSYLRDFIDEHDLYHDAGRLVRFLVGWRAPPDVVSLSDVIVHLTYDMATEGFWSVDEVDMVVAWLRDLRRSGYTFPTLPRGRNRTSSSCRRHVNTPEEQARARLELDMHHQP